MVDQKRPVKCGNEYVADCLADEFGIKCFEYLQNKKFNSDNEDDKDELSEIKEDLKDVFESSSSLEDAYCLVKDLDDHHDWDCGDELVDIMGGVSSSADKHYKKVLSDWIKAFNIVPKYKVGDYVNFNWAGKFKGHITSINESTATYYINRDGDSVTRNCLVIYENVDGLVNESI